MTSDLASINVRGLYGFFFVQTGHVVDINVRAVKYPANGGARWVVSYHRYAEKNYYKRSLEIDIDHYNRYIDNSKIKFFIFIFYFVWIWNEKSDRIM